VIRMTGREEGLVPAGFLDELIGGDKSLFPTCHCFQVKP
jgi:hypothetical protein